MPAKPIPILRLLYPPPWRLLALSVLAGLLVIWTGFFRPRDETGVPLEQFWRMKMDWQHCADCVLAGDSRVLISVPPASVAAGLPGLRVLNAGYSGTAYTPAYLTRLTQILDPHSPDRSLVLGITPRSFTRFAARFGDFERRVGRDELRWFMAEMRWSFERIQLKNLLSDLLPTRPIARDFRHYCPDGWTAMFVENAGDLGALPHYQELFSSEDVRPEWIDGLMAAVRQWTTDDIRVYGFRPPCAPEMLALETRLSTFNEEDFVRRFEEAGGVWIYVEQTAYPTFDGSHMPWPGALEFGRDLGHALAAARANGARAVRAERTYLNPLPTEWYQHLPDRHQRFYREAWARQRQSGEAAAAGVANRRTIPAGD